MVILIGFFVYANAQINNPPELGQRLQSLIDSRFEATKCPELSDAVASHNRIILSKTWGKADGTERPDDDSQCP
jgi:hypothetical protein